MPEYPKLNERRRNLIKNKYDFLIMKNKLKPPRGSKHLIFHEILRILDIKFDSKKYLSSGSTIKRSGIKVIFDKLNEEENIIPEKITKKNFLKSIFILQGIKFENNLDVSKGGTITSWALLKIIQSLK